MSRHYRNYLVFNTILKTIIAACLLAWAIIIIMCLSFLWFGA